MTHASTLTPDVEHRIRASFARQGLMLHLGAQLTDLAPGLARIRLPFRPELTQQAGFFHAGSTSAIADTAGGYAGYTLFPEGTDVLTVEFKINLLAPAVGDYLEATGTVIRSGRTLTICQIDVAALKGDQRTQVAISQQTLICVQAKL